MKNTRPLQWIVSFSQPPLFWIHLNIDYPFNLTGILFFQSSTTRRNCRRTRSSCTAIRVYVTDEVKGTLYRNFLLLHGVIDSPDIPLNVSRSYLQTDGNVKRLPITSPKSGWKKLENLFKRAWNFEQRWQRPGVLWNMAWSAMKSSMKKAIKFALLKTQRTNTLPLKSTKKDQGTQTDKHERLVCIYANNVKEQYLALKVRNHTATMYWYSTVW